MISSWSSLLMCKPATPCSKCLRGDLRGLNESLTAQLMIIPINKKRVAEISASLHDKAQQLQKANGY